MPVVNKQYLLVKRLGEGAQGKVKLVLNLQDMGLYAIKFISKKHLRSSIRRMSKSSRRSSTQPGGVRALACGQQPARTQSMPLSASRRSGSLTRASSQSSSDAAKRRVCSLDLTRASSLPPPSIEAEAPDAIVQAGGGGPVSSPLRQAPVPRAPPRQKRVRALAHRPPSAARTFPPAARAQLLSRRASVGGSDGPHGKSRMRSKSEEPKMRVAPSTASAEISRLRQRSAQQRTLQAAVRAVRAAAGPRRTTALLESVAHAPDAVTAVGNHGKQLTQARVLTVHTGAQLPSLPDAAQQVAAAPVGSSQQATSGSAATQPGRPPDDLQLLQQAGSAAPVKLNRRQRQRAHSVGPTAGGLRTLSVPAVTAAAEAQSAFAAKQPYPFAMLEASALEPLSPTGDLQRREGSSEQSCGSPPVSPKHRRRRSRSTGPLTADILSAHAAAQATLRTQSVSTVSVTSCPKLDELLSVLWASGTAAKQRGAFQSIKTYSEPWLPLQPSGCPVTSPFDQLSRGSAQQQVSEQPLDYRSLVPRARAAVPDLAPAADGDAASSTRLRSNSAAALAAPVASAIASQMLLRGHVDHNLQQIEREAQQASAAAVPAPGSGRLSSLYETLAARQHLGTSLPDAVTSQRVAQRIIPATQRRKGTSTAQSPFAAPELQAGSGESTPPDRGVATPHAEGPAAVSLTGPQAPGALAARPADSSKASAGGAAPPLACCPATANPVNDYLAIMREAHSEELSMESASRAATFAFQSPFSKSRSRMTSAPPRLPRLDSKESFNGPLLHSSYRAAADAAIAAVAAEAALDADAVQGTSSRAAAGPTTMREASPSSERPRTADPTMLPFSSNLPSAPSQADRTELLKRHSMTPVTEGKPLRLPSMVSISGSTPNDVVREIAVLKKLDHPNIVKLREVIDDPSSDSLLLVMEYVAGGSLEQAQVGPPAARRWDPLPEAVTLRYVQEICQGLEYLHANHVVHGDLKPANLLRGGDGRIKIVDFGSALEYQETVGAWDGQVTSSPACMTSIRAVSSSS